MRSANIFHCGLNREIYLDGATVRFANPRFAQDDNFIKDSGVSSWSRAILGDNCGNDTFPICRSPNFPVPLRPLSRYLGVQAISRAAMISYRLYPVLAFGATAAIIGYALLSRKNKKSPEQLEKERRTDLTRGGRIIDGNVIDVLELEEDETGRR